MFFGFYCLHVPGILKSSTKNWQSDILTALNWQILKLNGHIIVGKKSLMIILARKCEFSKLKNRIWIIKKWYTKFKIAMQISCEEKYYWIWKKIRYKMRRKRSVSMELHFPFFWKKSPFLSRISILEQNINFWAKYSF